MGDRIMVHIDSDLEPLIPGFLDNRGNDVQLLRDALSEGEVARVQSIGHGLKGVGGGYGFERISEIGAGLEEAAKRNDNAAIEQLIADLEDYLARVDVVYQ